MRKLRLPLVMLLVALMLVVPSMAMAATATATAGAGALFAGIELVPAAVTAGVILLTTAVVFSEASDDAQAPPHH
ncbi:MAG: hypothetical protein JRF41_10485 [Deltaproteobacteria bacterium]|nr:hypothetical protein [Deltaproteobacteria bacterium]